MKVLVVVHYALPHMGGMEMVAKKQIDSLISLGHEVTLLTCRHSSGLRLSEETTSGCRVIRLRALNFIESKLGITFPVISPLAFFTFVKQVKAHDVVHIHDTFYMTSHMAGIAAVFARRPLFLTQHVAIVDHPKLLIKLIQQVLYATLGALLFRRATAINVYNTSVRKFLLRRGVDSGRIFLNSNGIDTQFFTPSTVDEKTRLKKKYGFPEDKPVVIFAGRLIPEKGFSFVFDARSAAHTTLIVGRGNIPKRMQGKKDVVFFGDATQEELADLYRLSDVFVFPASVEIFALVMQEAVACGLPVIVADNPHYASYGLEPGLVSLVSRDKESIKNEIMRLLADAKLRSSMGEYSRRLAVKRFSWENNYPGEFKMYDLINSDTSINNLRNPSYEEGL